MDAERGLHRVLIEGATQGLFSSAHDCSEGGLAVTVAESALAGAIGFSLEVPESSHAIWFSESPSRAVVSCPQERVEAVRRLADEQGVPSSVLGSVGGDSLRYGTFEVPLDAATDVFEGAFRRMLSASMS